VSEPGLARASSSVSHYQVRIALSTSLTERMRGSNRSDDDRKIKNTASSHPDSLRSISMKTQPRQPVPCSVNPCVWRPELVDAHIP